ncbi:YkgJ family cysteine cluster protein [Sulfolobus acidocaldarius]|uniref:Conserved protein n=4 Tax=Sulfolobus acidocaldarius TaxID=2285 RepID=Q4J7U4_SULAC|nr:YkgJ family cysteine cluster protein [Sulfolobus acidocaldarius]AAY81138.1 conserved protein [Sulfolobus acidocaldarius DSM 639]AGE71749.1 hypothetical protein SacN8_08945 [Sulfolobus acidocaldarius N8]AGE74022.1 hypothetical protein SacRon12I_08955 [Sulfolobus acidocaldarius Ron12/I]ALU30048.1 hypothetical protein ATY89_08955 [Sulfolobus acidocaldarius]ALU30739.1 hypothetical protein ATZ20_00370 [Sulfolobus acidocaldarius]
MSVSIEFETKKGLREDLEAFERILNALEKYETIPIVKFGLYSLVFQLAMNVFLDVSSYCERCGGKCCDYGFGIPVYEFDYKEIVNKLGGAKGISDKRDSVNFRILERPCPYKRGWACGIHSFKPYACLSFPFSTEDEQKEVMDTYNGEGIPEFKLPEYCIAGKKVREIVKKIIDDLTKRLGRQPSPRELYEELKSRFSYKLIT